MPDPISLSVWLAVGMVLFGLSWWLLRGYVTLAKKCQMLDRPEARSSHTRPTPNSGGLVFVAVSLITSAVAYCYAWLPAEVAHVTFIGGGIMAALGLWDDKRPLPAWLRFLVQGSVVSYAIVACGSIKTLNILGVSWVLGVFGGGLTWLGLVWMINFYNFMDGIDGIAGVETVFVLGVLSVFAAQHQHLALLSLTVPLACAVFAFLRWNWAPAKVFMGDVGSVFLGYILGVLLLISIPLGFNLWSWLITLSVFWVDATLTVLRRWWMRQSVSQAHRTHAYQHAANEKYGHARVSVAVTLINGVWLLPWIVLSQHSPQYGVLYMLAAVLPLFFLAIKFNAGSQAQLM